VSVHTRDRIAASSGLVAVVLIVIGFFLTGVNPNWNASGTTIAHDYASQRDSGLASIIIVGVGLMALLWFAATLGSAFRAAREDRIGSVVVAGAVAFVSIFAIAGLTQWTLFYGSASGDPALTRAIYQVSALASSLAFLPGALMVAATAVGAAVSKRLPSWYPILGGIAAVLMFIEVCSVAQSGFFSPSGGYSAIGLLALAVWLVVTSIVLIRSFPSARTAER
jgi:hypothetical protein